MLEVTSLSYKVRPPSADYQVVCGAQLPARCELAAVVAAWPKLPEAIKAGMMAIVKAATVGVC